MKQIPETVSHEFIEWKTKEYRNRKPTSIDKCAELNGHIVSRENFLKEDHMQRQKTNTA